MEGALAPVNRCSLFLFVFALQVLLNGRGAGIPDGAASRRNSAELQCDSATAALILMSGERHFGPAFFPGDHR